MLHSFTAFEQLYVGRDKAEALMSPTRGLANTNGLAEIDHRLAFRETPRAQQGHNRPKGGSAGITPNAKHHTWAVSRVVVDALPPFQKIP
jgi:hypothetical protein